MEADPFTDCAGEQGPALPGDVYRDSAAACFRTLAFLVSGRDTRGLDILVERALRLVEKGREADRKRLQVVR